MVVNAVPATNPSPLPTEAEPLVEARLLNPTEVVSIASLTPPDPTLLSPPQPIPTQTSRREGKLSMPWILQVPKICTSSIQIGYNVSSFAFVSENLSCNAANEI